jgi:hypothetical protein
MNEDTKGVINKQGFISKESGEDDATQAPQMGNDPHGFGQVPGLIKALEEHLSFTILLVNVVGYVVIASFGGMNSLGQYLGYILFLSLSFVFYKILYSNIKLKNSTLILTLILIVAVSIIIIQNFHFLEILFKIHVPPS